MTVGIWYTLFTVSNVLPFLNSLLNPAILITRGKSLKEFALGLVQQVLRQGPGDRTLATRGSVTYGAATSMTHRNNLALIPPSKGLTT